jgi:hypothetical protein
MAGEDVVHITLGYPALTGIIYESWASVAMGYDSHPPDSSSPYIEIDER